MRMTRARPSATSATVMQMVNTVKIIPETSPRKRAKATRLMLTALSISSMPSRMPMVFRRGRTPNRPMQKSMAARGREAWSATGPVDRPGEEERAHQGGQEQHTAHLEGHHVGGEHPLPDRPG